MGKINTTIPAIPNDISPQMFQFLSAIKTQIETREGSRRKDVRDEKFVTIKDLQIEVDDSINEVDKKIRALAMKVGKAGQPLDLSWVRIELNTLDRKIKNLQNFHLPMKDKVLWDTFIHVGPDLLASDEAWRPTTGTGILYTGIYSILGDNEKPIEHGVPIGRFLLSSEAIADLGEFEPFFGDAVFAGEFRVGDDVSYNATTQILEGDNWLWYHPTKGLQINIKTAGSLSIGDYGTNSGISIDTTGMIGTYQGSTVFAFSYAEKVVNVLGASYTIPAGSGVFTGWIYGSIISSPNIISEGSGGWNWTRRVDINQHGILGWSKYYGAGHSSNQLGFAFALQDVSHLSTPYFEFTAGSAYFSGMIWGSTIWGSAITMIQGTRALTMNQNGIFGFNYYGGTPDDPNNDLAFRFSLADGSALFKGDIKASVIEGSSFTVIDGNRRIIIDEVGIRAWSNYSNNVHSFICLTKAWGGYPAGSAYFAGILYAGSVIVGSPEVTLYDLVCTEEGGKLKKVDQSLVTADGITDGDTHHFAAEFGAVKNYSSLTDDGGTLEIYTSKQKILGADGIEIEPGGNLLLKGEEGLVDGGQFIFNYVAADDSIYEAVMSWNKDFSEGTLNLYPISEGQLLSLGAPGVMQDHTQWKDVTVIADGGIYLYAFKDIDDTAQFIIDRENSYMQWSLYSPPALGNYVYNIEFDGMVGAFMPVSSDPIDFGRAAYRWNHGYFGGNLDVTGSVSKGSGSFLIDHPLAPTDKLLRYGFTESPRYDLIHRGTVQLKDGKAKIDIDASYGLTPGTFQVLCQDAQVMSVQAVDSFVRVKAGAVVDGTFEIEAEDKGFNGLVNWLVIAERKDPHVIRSEHTDKDGHLINEIDKPEPDMTLLDDEERPPELEHDPEPKVEKIYVEKEQVVEEWDVGKHAYIRRKKMVKVPEYEFVDVLDEVGKVVDKRRTHKTIEHPAKPRPKRPVEQKKSVNMGQYKGFYREPGAYGHKHPVKQIKEEKR